MCLILLKYLYYITFIFSIKNLFKPCVLSFPYKNNKNLKYVAIKTTPMSKIANYVWILSNLQNVLFLRSQDVSSPERWSALKSRINVFSWWSSGSEADVSLLNRFMSIHNWWKMANEAVLTELRTGSEEIKSEGKSLTEFPQIRSDIQTQA